MSELLRIDYEVCIIDSIQTIYSGHLNSSPGSVSQVREITFELMRKAKRVKYCYVYNWSYYKRWKYCRS